MKSVKSKSINSNELSTVTKLYLWGLHGLLIDLCYNAYFESLGKGQLRFNGYTSILAIPVFGGGFLLQEYLSLYLRKNGVPFYTRGFIYVIVTYMYEFSTGYLLAAFGHSFWDYTGFDYNFMGLITFELAPIWFVLTLASEKFLIDAVRNLTVVDNN